MAAESNGGKPADPMTALSTLSPKPRRVIDMKPVVVASPAQMLSDASVALAGELARARTVEDSGLEPDVRMAILKQISLKADALKKLIQSAALLRAEIEACNRVDGRDLHSLSDLETLTLIVESMDSAAIVRLQAICQERLAALAGNPLR